MLAIARPAFNGGNGPIALIDQSRQISHRSKKFTSMGPRLAIEFVKVEFEG